MLDDHRGGKLELAKKAPSRVEVEQIVERELLAVELCGTCKQVRSHARFLVIGSALMRVFAI